jgi:hypothetical protein
MAFSSPPSTSATANTSSQPYQGSFPPLSPSNPYSGLFSSPGDDKSGTAAQRAFPGPITAASGLNDRLAAAKTTAPRPLSPNPRPFLVPPTSNPFGPYTPSPSAPQLPQAASSQQFAPLGQGPENPFAGVQPLAPLPTSAPTPAQAQQTNMNLDMAANPSQYQQPQLVGQGWKGFLKYGIPAALMSAGSGLSNMGRGDPTTGFKLLGDQAANDRGVPAANAAEYRLRNVQPLQDALATQQAGANLQHTKAETGDIANKSQQQLAQHGLKSVTDPGTGLTSVVPDPDSPVYKANQDKDAKLQAQTDLIGAQQTNAAAQTELRAAQTAFTNNKSDPNSLVSKQVAQRLATAQRNSQISAGKLSQSQLTYKARYLGTGADNQSLAGTMITDDGTPVGSAFSGNVRPTGTERNKGDMANSAADQLGTIKQIVQAHPELFGPGYGQTTEFKKWIGGQSPEAQRFLSARTIAADHLSATFGGHSEYATKALDDAIGQFKDNPATAMAGIDQLAGANSRFQAAGAVKTTGSNAAKGGNTSPPTGGGQGSISVTAPDGSVHPFKSQAAADRFKKLAGMTK